MGIYTALSAAGPSVVDFGLRANQTRQLAATTPSKTPSDGAAQDKLTDALEDYLQENSGRPVQYLNTDENYPTKTGIANLVDGYANADKYASSGRIPDMEDGYSVNINPNADRSFYAHELGHVAAQQFPVGDAVHKLDNNPGLKKALIGAMLLAPGTAAAFEAGDDDMDTSIALALAAASPTLVKEGLANKHALALMDKADMRASLGQRGRLAGGMLTYLSAPIAVAAAGNIVGNQFDENPSELPM